MYLKRVRTRIMGFVALIAVIFLDQWSKSALLQAADMRLIPHEISTFFNLVMVRNHGVSFGLFSGLHVAVPFLLTAVTSLVALALIVWLTRAEDMWIALALGFIIGGALGNIMDRVRFGAVTDFLDFHLGTYHWPAFNLADSAIFIGVVILVLISIVRPAKEKENEK